MTDDDLDRALFALALEQPPAGLHDRILAATVYRIAAPAPFRTWELWVLAVAVAVVAFATFALVTSVPSFGERSSSLFEHALYAAGLFSPETYGWLAAGISAMWAISNLPLMPRSRPNVYNR